MVNKDSQKLTRNSSVDKIDERYVQILVTAAARRGSPLYSICPQRSRIATFSVHRDLLIIVRLTNTLIYLLISFYGSSMGKTRARQIKMKMK